MCKQYLFYLITWKSIISLILSNLLRIIFGNNAKILNFRCFIRISSTLTGSWVSFVKDHILLLRHSCILMRLIVFIILSLNFPKRYRCSLGLTCRQGITPIRTVTWNQSGQTSRTDLSPCRYTVLIVMIDIILIWTLCFLSIEKHWIILFVSLKLYLVTIMSRRSITLIFIQVTLRS